MIIYQFKRNMSKPNNRKYVFAIDLEGGGPSEDILPISKDTMIWTTTTLKQHSTKDNQSEMKEMMNYLKKLSNIKSISIKIISIGAVFGSYDLDTKKINIIETNRWSIKRNQEDFNKQTWDEFWSKEEQQKQLNVFNKEAISEEQAAKNFYKMYLRALKVDKDFTLVTDNPGYDVHLLSSLLEKYGMNDLQLRPYDGKLKHRMAVDVNGYGMGWTSSPGFMGASKTIENPWSLAKKFEPIQQIIDKHSPGNTHMPDEDAVNILLRYVVTYLWLIELEKQLTKKRKLSKYLELLDEKEIPTLDGLKVVYDNKTDNSGNSKKKMKKK